MIIKRSCHRIYVSLNLKYVITMNKIIQEKINALEAAREVAEQKYSLIANAAIDAIIMITQVGTISFWNPGAEKIFGYKKEEALGKDLHLLIAPEKYHDRYKKGFEMFKQAGSGPFINRLTELTAIKKNGTEFPIGLSLSAAKSGELWVSIGIIRDISRRKRDEKALKNARTVLEETVENRTAELKKANSELSEANVALKVLLKKSGEQNTEIEDKIMLNIDSLVFPYLEELLSKLKDEKNRGLCTTITENLKLVTSSFNQTLIMKYSHLSPREIQVADFIRHGKSTKEIAFLMGISTYTVDTYRGNLRKKLDIKNKRMNLKIFLETVI